ncbi:MAG: DUF6174 domain-containing protein [Gemmatimonadota bacterium]|nr:DUF6174 domain-containing protein [Gemmatimonadota bacterium]
MHDYGYTGRKFCFCYPANEVFVTVRSDTISSVRVVATGVELPKGGWLTVGQLFDFAEGSFGEKDKVVRVEYDRALGYPTLVDVQCPMIADCGVSIETKNLGRLGVLN